MSLPKTEPELFILRPLLEQMMPWLQNRQNLKCRHLLVKDENDNLVPLVDLQGRFRPEMGEYAGKYVKNEYYDEGEAPEKSVDVELAIKLKIENKAFKVEKYVHSYPNCWRTDKPILYYPLDSWFIKVTDFRDRMFELNNTINWKPKATGEGTFWKLVGECKRLEFISFTVLGNSVATMENRRWKRRNRNWFG